MAFVHTVTALVAGTSAMKRRLFGDALRRLRGGVASIAVAAVEDEPPLRAELLSAEQMERHGKVLAQGHELRHTPTPDVLLRRLADNEAALVRTCDLLVAATSAKRRIPPSGEWLLDNFYLHRTDPDREATPAARLQRSIAAVAHRSFGRTAARIRHRPRSDRAWRRAGRSREHDPLHRRLPERDPAEARRAVGDSHHVAACADRESAARGRAYHARTLRPRFGGVMGRAHDRWGRRRSEQSDTDRRGHGPVGPAHGGRFCRGAGAPAAGASFGARSAADVARAAFVRIGLHASSSSFRPKTSSRRPTRFR